MNIVIVGCGKVGGELAATLTADGNSVAVIDKSQAALDRISEDLDVLTVCGDGADVDVLKEAGIETAEIFIAVSPDDEVNLLTCVIAKTVSAAETIARVRKPMYYREADFFLKNLGISKVINPEQQAAADIYKLLCYPALSRVDKFANGNVLIFTLHCRGEYGFAGHSLAEVRRDTKARILACAVYRKGEVFIPGGSFVIEKDDEVTFVTPVSDMGTFLKEHNIDNTPTMDILISGGGKITWYLTDRLVKAGRHVRIIEIKESTCEVLSERFPEAEVICGDGTDRRFLIKQGLKNADAFVAATGIDEENIITANFARKTANIKAITKVNRTDLRDVIEALDIDSAVFPKVVTADKIAQYVRAKASGVGENLEALYRYMGTHVEIVEFRAVEGDRGLDVPLMDLEVKKDLIVACIIRGEEIIIPSGRDKVRVGDSVIIVTSHKGITSMGDILES